jgi:hypothetical protein
MEDFFEMVEAPELPSSMDTVFASLSKEVLPHYCL